MEQQKTSKVMIGILICLILITFKPTASFEHENDHISVEDFESEQVIHGNNRIAIIDNNWNPGNHGNITVLEFNEETKQFEKVSASNYLDHIQY